MMHKINIGPTCDTHFNNHPNIQAYMFTLQTCRSRRWRSTKCWLPSPPGLAGWHWLIYIDREGKKVGEMREHGGGRCSRGVVWKVLIHVCSFCAESDPKWRKIPVTLRIWSQTVPWQFLVGLFFDPYEQPIFVVFSSPVGTVAAHRFQTCVISSWLMWFWAHCHMLICGT